MNWLLVISVVLIVVGCAFSILRDPSTIDYCKMSVSDGRKDSYAKGVVLMYRTGQILAAIGTVLLIITTILISLK